MKKEAIVPPKHGSFSKLYGVTTQMAVLFTVTTQTISNIQQ
jgi:predicted transcriptional regulator